MFCVIRAVNVNMYHFFSFSDKLLIKDFFEKICEYFHGLLHFSVIVFL
jgi:hypothetical protein